MLTNYCNAKKSRSRIAIRNQNLEFKHRDRPRTCIPPAAPPPPPLGALWHGAEAKAEDALRRMAVQVNGQNAGDPGYRPMAPGFDGPAFRAARGLALFGARRPSGYAEPVLHARRREGQGGRGLRPPRLGGAAPFRRSALFASLM